MEFDWKCNSSFFSFRLFCSSTVFCCHSVQRGGNVRVRSPYTTVSTIRLELDLN